MPGSVTAMLGLLVVIHIVRGTLSIPFDNWVLMEFAFIPARYVEGRAGLPGGTAADIWTFFTYALLHGSWIHLVTNAVWLVAFGSAVARRFGPLRFWIFSAMAAASGAALHLALHFGEPIPVVGASAAIAGQMAAAARFVFDVGGPAGMRRSAGDAAYRRPARSLLAIFANRSAVIFVAIWFGVNLMVGIGGFMSGGVAVAWEAHIGGFLFGLLAFRLFDPVPTLRR
ncbi:rhomboid family intramembrane serine protease [Acuticoccus sp. 2012]|uniref:Rhomboid family intramembrane serine protease n=2 Tax=Acuticoccus mangrovi TaxID=2796142 RepID=A0A934IPF4_9HYPH|nr:rhomboid family intramembrane serine protease [Acuticoccus mangrovi]MBJ3776315.1 rhomboid family intramembrane serine protease [Acuticoccus mangrovi]